MVQLFLFVRIFWSHPQETASKRSFTRIQTFYLYLYIGSTMESFIRVSRKHISHILVKDWAKDWTWISPGTLETRMMSTTFTHFNTLLCQLHTSLTLILSWVRFSLKIRDIYVSSCCGIWCSREWSSRWMQSYTCLLCANDTYAAWFGWWKGGHDARGLNIHFDIF